MRFLPQCFSDAEVYDPQWRFGCERVFSQSTDSTHYTQGPNREKNKKLVIRGNGRSLLRVDGTSQRAAVVPYGAAVGWSGSLIAIGGIAVTFQKRWGFLLVATVLAISAIAPWLLKSDGMGVLFVRKSESHRDSRAGGAWLCDMARLLLT